MIFDGHTACIGVIICMMCHRAKMVFATENNHIRSVSLCKEKMYIGGFIFCVTTGETDECDEPIIHNNTIKQLI